MPFDQTTYEVELEASAVAEDKTTERALFALAALLIGLWGASVALFGVPGLFIPAVMAVPVVFLMLIRLTRG